MTQIWQTNKLTKNKFKKYRTKIYLYNSKIIRINRCSLSHRCRLGESPRWMGRCMGWRQLAVVRAKWVIIISAKMISISWAKILSFWQNQQLMDSSFSTGVIWGMVDSNSLIIQECTQCPDKTRKATSQTTTKMVRINSKTVKIRHKTLIKIFKVRSTTRNCLKWWTKTCTLTLLTSFSSNPSTRFPQINFSNLKLIFLLQSNHCRCSRISRCKTTTYQMMIMINSFSHLNSSPKCCKGCTGSSSSSILWSTQLICNLNIEIIRDRGIIKGWGSTLI